MLYLQWSVVVFAAAFVNSVRVASLPQPSLLKVNQNDEEKTGCHQIIDSDRPISTVGDSTCSYAIQPPMSTNTIIKSRGKSMLSCHKLKRLIQLFDVESGERVSICTDGEPGIYFRGTSKKYKLLIKPTGYEIPLKIEFERTLIHCDESVPSDALGHRLRLKFDEEAGLSCAIQVPGGTVIEIHPSKTDYFQEHITTFRVFPNSNQYFKQNGEVSARSFLESGTVTGGFVWCNSGVLMVTRMSGHPVPDPIEFVLREITDEEQLENYKVKKEYNCQ